MAERNINVNFSADIGNFESAMSNVNSTMQGVGDTISDSMNSAQSATEKGASGMKGAFSGIGLAVGAVAGLVASAFVAIGGAVVGGVMSANSYQQAMNGLQAETGATSSEIDSMGDSMKNIYKNNFGESFEDVAKTMATAKQATGTFGSELEGLSQNALMLRDTFGYDVSESLRASDKLMDNFGVTGEQAMAMIAEATQGGLNKSEDLMDTIDEYSQYYDAAGLSGQEMFASLENASAAGIRNLDYAGDAMKEFGIIMTEDSTKASDALTAMGLPAQALQDDFAAGGEGAKAAFQTIVGELGKIEDPLKQNQLGVELFGTKFEDVGAAGILAMANLDGSVKGSAATLESLNAIKYDSFTEAFAGIGRQLQVGLLLPLGEKLLPYLNDFANWVSSKIPGIVEYFSSIGTTVEGLLVKFGTVFEQIKPVVSEFISSFMTAFQNLMPTFTEAQGYATIFSEGFKTVFSTMSAVVVPIMQRIGTKVMEVVSLIVSWWQSNGAELLANVMTTFNGIWSVIQFIMPAVLAVISMVMDNVKGVISGALNIISGAFKIFAGLFTGDWSKMWDGVKQLVSGAIQFLWNLWNLMLYGRLLAAIKLLGTKSIGLFKSMWSGIKNIWSTFTNWVQTSIAKMVTGTVSKFTSMLNHYRNIFNTLRTFGASVWNAIWSIITNIAGKIFTAVTSKFTNLKNTAVTTFNSLKSTASRIFSSLKTAMMNPVNAARDAIKRAIDKIKGFFSGLKLKFPKITMPKMPSFSLKGEFSLKPPSVPKIGINWNAKGGVFNKPTVFNTANAGLQGVGEAGSEAIIPLNKSVLGNIGKGIASTMKNQNQGSSIGIEKLVHIENFSGSKKETDKLATTLITSLQKLGVSYN
ncbi:phage tail tape measure protein [Planococcus sp. SIMBA_143]